MTNPIIETDLAQVLNKLDNKIDKLDEKIDNLALGQAEIKGDIKALEVKVNNIDETAKELKGNQKTLITDVSSLKGVRSLIIPIVVAVISSVLTVFLRTFSVH